MHATKSTFTALAYKNQQFPLVYYISFRGKGNLYNVIDYHARVLILKFEV